MKALNLLFFLGLVLARNLCYNQDTIKEPVIFFEKEVHDYGTIEYGSNGNCEFIVTNTGTAPLILESVKGSCSCMVADWSRNPILPGKTAKIKVKYDTYRAGPINKTVTVQCNDPKTPFLVLRIKGTVLPAPPPVFHL